VNFKRWQKGLALVVHACNPSYPGGGDRRILFEVSLGKVIMRPYLKNKLKARAEGVVQVVRVFRSPEFNVQY
jgi:hypothetical protein